jgi:hypothetical protein
MKKVLFAVACFTGLTLAGFSRAGVEADPNKEYAVTPEAGPWLVCVSCFVGPQAPQLAHEMVLEIRSRFNLPAYVRNKGEEERRVERERLRKYHEEHPEANVPLKTFRIEDQCAVLVGGYADMESAHRALGNIKQLPPPSKEYLCPVLSEIGKSDEEGKSPVRIARVNPFINSHVCRNPAAPLPRAGGRLHDAEELKLIKALNSDEKYTLLRCRKPYTLMVATYQGTSMIKSDADSGGFLDKIWGKSHALEISGQNAHNLAEVLRRPPLEFEAYVLHLRGGSVVSIGGFDSKDDPRMNQVSQAIHERLQTSQSNLFLPKPVAIEVPRP